MDRQIAEFRPDLPRGRQLDVQVGRQDVRAAGQVAGQAGNGGQEALLEMLAHFRLLRGPPARLAGGTEPFDDPAKLAKRVTVRLDGLLEIGPAGKPMFPGDGPLRVVQRGKLAAGEPPPGFEFQETQAGAGG